MKSERVYSIINYFLYFLLLIALGIILYLLYFNWYSRNVEEAANNGGGVKVEEGSGGESVIDVSESHSSAMGSFSYIIPSGWDIEENTDANYAIVRNDNNQNIISVRIVTKQDSMQELPFDQYAALAAKNEIQGYQSLNTIDEVTTDSGVTGYKTTWNIQFLGGEEFVSNPITYFEHPIDPSKSVQISLENGDFMSVYDNLIKSFQIEQ